MCLTILKQFKMIFLEFSMIDHNIKETIKMKVIFKIFHMIINLIIKATIVIIYLTELSKT